MFSEILISFLSVFVRRQAMNG